MKKNYVMMAAFASLLACTACSEDAAPLMDQEPVNQSLAADEDIIEIAISNTGVGTRTARPVGSSAASNNVDKVQLKFYSRAAGQPTAAWTENKSVNIAAIVGASQTSFAGNVIDFKALSSERPSQQPQPEEKYQVKLSGLAQNTAYRIVAYGYNTTFPYDPTSLTFDTNGIATATRKAAAASTGYDLEEVFAGHTDKATKATSGKFTTAPVVTLTRQVAGMLAYFQIPVYANGEKVEVVKVIANQQTNGFRFPNFLLADKDFNGTAPTSAEDVLMTFTMSECAANYAQVNAQTEYYTTDAVKKGLADGYVAPKNLKLAENAFFGGRYILPYDKHYDAQTLKVVLYGGVNKDKVLKTLKVITDKVPASLTNDPNGKYNYDIRCNNFYSIGKKMAAGTITGKPDPQPQPDPQPDPNPDPQPQPDKPVDLGATEQIIVQINDAWDVLHDMGVEE